MSDANSKKFILLQTTTYDCKIRALIQCFDTFLFD